MASQHSTEAPTKRKKFTDESDNNVVGPDQISFLKKSLHDIAASGVAMNAPANKKLSALAGLHQPTTRSALDFLQKPPDQDHVENNKKILQDPPSLLKHMMESNMYDPQSRTVKFNVDGDCVMRAAKDFVDAIAIDRPTGNAKMVFGPSKSRHVSGGWQGEGYADVPVRENSFDKNEQRRCVFTFQRSADLQQLLIHSKYLNKIYNAVLQRVNELSPTPTLGFKLRNLTFLLQFQEHALFTSHLDKLNDFTPDISVITSCTWGTSSVVIIGAEKPAVFDEPGDTHVFAGSQLYHRSGGGERRTIKIAWFFEQIEAQEIENSVLDALELAPHQHMVLHC